MKNRWKIFKQIFSVAYLHVISFTKHKKDAATEAYLEPSQIFMMELFYEQQLTISKSELFLLSFTFIKVPS